MLEKMDEFFNSRLSGYEEHQLTAIDGAREFYPFTASLLPTVKGAKVIDLGCGTGLELEYYFKINASAEITGIDMAEDMLYTLKEKFSDKALTLIRASYFDIPLGENVYDAVVSVMSLHHFTKDEKVPLYKKVYSALKDEGYFILTDYFALTEEDEIAFRQDLLRLKEEQGISGNGIYHYDTPLTVEHEMQALKDGGFSSIEILRQWGTTYTLKAKN